MDYQPQPFFSRGPAPLVRLTFFASLAIFLMVLDARFHYADSLRQVVALLAYPLQRVAVAPVELLGAVPDYFTSQVNLKGENETLKAKRLQAASELLTLDPLRAEVTLITDKEQVIPVQVVRNGLRAVVFGGGEGGTLDLRYMAANADIQAGDVLVTSGIDGTYPAGLPVATVSRIERDSAYAFARVTCVPNAGAGQNKQVLVLTWKADLPRPPSETETVAEGLAKQKRAKRRE